MARCLACLDRIVGIPGVLMNRRAFFASLLVPFIPKPAKPLELYRDTLNLFVNLSIARQAFQQAMKAAVTEATGFYSVVLAQSTVPTSPALPSTCRSVGFSTCRSVGKADNTD